MPAAIEEETWQFLGDQTCNLVSYVGSVNYKTFSTGLKGKSNV